MDDRRRSTLKTVAMPILLVLAVGVALVWEISARFSSRPFDSFALTAAAFEGFVPDIPGWSVSAVPVPTNSPSEPNILCFVARRGSKSAMLRLVHGYNMPMCMKIKGYTVEVLEATDHGLGTGERDASVPFQVWKVTSSVGDSSVWLTTMLRAGDYEPTADDVRSMPFPRVATPDDPRWNPEGFTWASLRHPIREIRTRLRARWNSSRTDFLTFLRLRRPAWASEELLTLVSCSLTPHTDTEDEGEWVSALRELQTCFTRSLRARAGGRRGQ